jgi:hypothetical protein
MDLRVFLFKQKSLASGKVIPVFNEATCPEDVCANGGESSVSRPGCFNLGTNGHDAHWIRGLLYPRGDLESVEKKNSFCPCSKSNPDSLIVQLVFTMQTEPSRILCDGKYFPFSHWLLKHEMQSPSVHSTPTIRFPCPCALWRVSIRSSVQNMTKSTIPRVF